MSSHENQPPAVKPRDPFMVGEFNPGTIDAVYDIFDSTGTNQIGVLVEMAGSNVQSGTGYTWLANRAYWQWTSGPAFPSSFVMRLDSYNNVPTWNPATATPITTCGPFGTTQVTPATGGRWWNVAMKEGTTSTAVGWLNQQSNGTLNWYSLAARTYLTLTSGQQLVFALNANAPTNAMYVSIDTPA